MLKRTSLFALVLMVLCLAGGCSDSTSEGSTASRANAKTKLRLAIVAVKSAQTDLDSTDFSGISFNKLSETMPELTFIDDPLGSRDGESTIGVITLSDEQIVMQTRSDDGECYFIELNPVTASRYGSSHVSSSDMCGYSPDAETGSDYTDSAEDGWASR